MNLRPDGPTERPNWARPHALWVLAVAALIGAWELSPGVCPPEPRPVVTALLARFADKDSRVLTPRRVTQLGNDSAFAFLHALGDRGALRAVETARTAVVRFKIIAWRVETSERSDSWGSGVLVNGGRSLLVAGHVLDGVEGHPDPRFFALTIDGRVRRCRAPAVRGGVDGAPDGDWGLVDLEGPPPAGHAALSMRSAVDDQTVVMLAYPEGLAVDAKGVVTERNPTVADPLYPLVSVGRVINAGSGRIETVAGAPSGGGASGGAVIDLEGNLVGVMVTTNYGWSKISMQSGAGGVAEPADAEAFLDASCRGKQKEWLGITGTPVRVFREFLEQRWK